MFFSSDATGEIYVITKEDGSGVNHVSQVGGQNSTNGTGSTTGTSAAPSPSGSSSAATRRWSDARFWGVSAAVAALALSVS